MDLFTLKKLAGHANIATSMRHIRMSDMRSREALEKVWGGHNYGHANKKAAKPFRQSGEKTECFVYDMELAEGIEPPTL